MDQYRILPDAAINLDDLSTNDAGGLPKKEGKEQLALYVRMLRDLQELLFAEHKHKVLVVLQGMDTSGKDGTIRHVFREVNPQGTRVTNFKKPTERELSHDYLWRVHPHTPGRGEIAIFNRSHYEDVLAVRVHHLVPDAVWEKRYDHINDFERLLADEGTTILKFFLHISQSEQTERFLDRLNQPDKHWKFNPSDLEERNYWKDYHNAYQDMLNRTSTAWAPWFVVPADRKWYRNLVVAHHLVDQLQGLEMAFPADLPDLQPYRARLMAMREATKS